MIRCFFLGHRWYRPHPESSAWDLPPELRPALRCMRCGSEQAANRTTRIERKQPARSATAAAQSDDTVAPALYVGSTLGSLDAAQQPAHHHHHAGEGSFGSDDFHKGGSFGGEASHHGGGFGGIDAHHGGSFGSDSSGGESSSDPGGSHDSGGGDSGGGGGDSGGGGGSD